MLDIGSWMLGVGSCVLVFEVGCWKSDVGYWILEAGCQKLNVRSWMLELGC